jgi:hypothetical protein
VVENQYCGDDHSGGSNVFFWYYGAHPVGGGSSIHRGTRLTGGSSRIVSTNKPALQAKGGFGASARSGGVGRAAPSGGG